MKNLFEQLEELKDALRTNVNADWSENDPSTEFSALAETLQNIVDNTPTKCCREFLKSQGYFVENLWTTGDVIGHGKNLDYEISEKQAIEIFELMGRRMDATIGINWDSIESAIEEFFND